MKRPYLWSMEDNTSAKFEFLASFILPNGILDWFDFIKASEEQVEKKDCIYKSTLHIYLDEKDNRTNEHLFLKPNGFTEPTVIKDFPVRNRNLILHVRRRRYLDENGKNVILNLYPTTAEGTRYSEEFAAFLKERLGYVPRSGPFAGAILPD